MRSGREAHVDSFFHGRDGFDRGKFLPTVHHPRRIYVAFSWGRGDCEVGVHAAVIVDAVCEAGRYVC